MPLPLRPFLLPGSRPPSQVRTSSSAPLPSLLSRGPSFWSGFTLPIRPVPSVFRWFGGDSCFSTSAPPHATASAFRPRCLRCSLPALPCGVIASTLLLYAVCPNPSGGCCFSSRSVVVHSSIPSAVPPVRHFGGPGSSPRMVRWFTSAFFHSVLVLLLGFLIGSPNSASSLTYLAAS